MALTVAHRVELDSTSICSVDRMFSYNNKQEGSSKGYFSVKVEERLYNSEDQFA